MESTMQFLSGTCQGSIPKSRAWLLTGPPANTGEGMQSLDNEPSVRDCEKMPLRLEPEAMVYGTVTFLERKGRQTRSKSWVPDPETLVNLGVALEIA